MIVQDFRPDPVIFAYWKERIVIAQDAVMLPVEFVIL